MAALKKKTTKRTAKPHGSNPSEVLHALSHGACLTIDELDACTDVQRSSISKSVNMLISRGFAERVEIGCYQLTRAGRKAAQNGEKIGAGRWRPLPERAQRPRASLRQKAWNVMRMGDVFTSDDLAMLAGSGYRRPIADLQSYICLLRRAGYLHEMPVRKRGTTPGHQGFRRYRLIRNTGPIAPVWQANRKVLFDHNLGERGECVPCP